MANRVGVPMLIFLLAAFFCTAFALHRNLMSPVPFVNPKNLVVVLLAIFILLIVNVVGLANREYMRSNNRDDY